MLKIEAGIILLTKYSFARGNAIVLEYRSDDEVIVLTDFGNVLTTSSKAIPSFYDLHLHDMYTPKEQLNNWLTDWSAKRKEIDINNYLR